MTTTKEPPPTTPDLAVDVVDVLRERIEAAGSATAAARALSVSPSYLLDVRHGRRPASGRLLAGLRLARIVVTSDPATGALARGAY